MKRENTHAFSTSQKAAYVHAFIEDIQPTHFVTISLVQSRVIHGGAWLRCDDIIYSEVHKSFMRSLSKKLVSRTAWERHQPILRSICAIEGGANGERNHMHVLINKPNQIAEDAFRVMAHRTAANSNWIMKGEYALDISAVGNSDEKIRAAFYSVKNGLDRICYS